LKAYIDTSVIISAYKPNETSYETAIQIAKLNDVVKVGSYVLVAELISVTSRLYKASQIRLQAPVKKILSKLPKEERAYALVNAIILDWNLSYPKLGFEVKQLKLRAFSLSVPEAILEACMIAPLVDLKTLDLMHIASAKIINEATHDLKYFVTLDQDILDSRDEVKKVAGCQPVTPQEFADLM